MEKPAKSLPNQQLKQARLRQGWSQEYVAREVGTDAFTVSRWERGVTLPSPHFRQKLSALFNLSVLELGILTQEKAEPAVHTPSAPVSQAPAMAPILDPAIPSAPAGGYGLVGRDSLLRELKGQLLTERHAARCALNGLPGAGKTALATALARDREVQKHFADGVLWAGLGRQPDVLGLLSRWGTMLGCIPSDLAQRSRPEAWAASIHAFIGQRRLLLVIDDAWNIADALALQVGGPRCAYLITTRFPEIARRSAADGVVVVRELEDTDGRLLLMRLAPEVVQAEPEEAQSLVTTVGGLPLALTLLGNFLRAQAHSGQPRRIRAALEKLHKIDERLALAEPQALIGSHPSLAAMTPLSLQAVIGVSEEQISAEARATLHALSVFPPKPNTFSEEAALEVSATPVEALDALTDAGLLESSSPGRYTLHQTIADYAHTRLNDTTVTERLVSYYVNFVELHETDYLTLDNESSNILAALEIAHKQGMKAALARGVHAFTRYLIAHGLYKVAETHLHRALEATQDLDDLPGQITMWLHLGKIAEHRGNTTQAQLIWQNALDLASEHHDASGMARALLDLGGLAWALGQPQQALELLEKALESLRQLGDQHGIADTLKTLGNLVAELGEPGRAQQLYTEALVVFRNLNDQRSTAIVLQNLGILARERGQSEPARKLYEQALAIFRLIGDQRGTATVLSNLGNMERLLGFPKRARQHLEESMTIHRSIENRRGLAFALLNLSNLAGDQRQFEQAHRYLNETLQLFQDLGDRRDTALTLQSLGGIAREQGQFTRADQLLQEALALFQDVQDRRQVALTSREQGLLARDQREFAAAQQVFTRALEIFEQLGDQREVAVTRRELGCLARQQGHAAEARQLLREALTSLRALKDRRNTAHTLKEAGWLAWQEEQAEEALPLLLSAAVGLDLSGLSEVADVTGTLAQIRARLGENTFLAALSRTAQDTPEPAYELTPAAWSAALQRLANQARP